MSTSSQPHIEVREIPLSALRSHPANPNRMGPEARAKLSRHIRRTGSYPPLITRPHGDGFQLLDGHQRADILRELGYTEALCVVWDCDDEAALLLLTTLNRLHGEDVPALRGLLIEELLETIDRELLLELIPEDASALDELLSLATMDGDPFAELEAAAIRALADSPTTITFVVTPDEEREVLEVIDARAEGRLGPRSRGRALVALVRHHPNCGLTDA
jgi:ParB-like chromosome segregation protein Spo0J